jgi:hypothetical protein
VQTDSDEEKGDRPEQERTHRQVAEQEDEQPADCIKEQYVAEPDEIEMREAEDREPEHARIMRARAAASRDGGAFDHQQGARPEQHRKHAAHLRIHENEVEEPCRDVAVGGRSARGGVAIGGEGQGKGDDVHRKDAHHRDPADRVEAFVARRGSPVHRLFLQVPRSVRASC